MPDSANSTKSKRRSLDHAAAVDDPGPVHKRPDMTWRDHLVMLLTSGAEVEHALMVQYLYAAYSLDGNQRSKKRREMVEGWRASILSVAREEMGHLLTVQNLLVLLGAPVNFGREMMPWDHEFYPFPFSLEPLSQKTLECFIYAEMPRPDEMGAKPVGKRREKAAPPLVSEEKQRAIIAEVKTNLAKRYKKRRVERDLHRVGQLYDEIIALISDPTRIPDSAFIEATYDMQADWDDWGRGYKPDPRELDPEGNIAHPDSTAGGPNRTQHPIATRPAHVQIERAATRAQAVKALRALAAQGEAPHLQEDETGEPSHFDRFIQIYKEYKEFKARDPSWKATHGIPANPTTRKDFHQLHPKDTTYIGIEHDEIAAHYFAQLFNQRYRLLLSYLAHSYRLARTQPLNQPGLRGMVMHRAFGEMYNLKTIAGLLVQLPLHRRGWRGAPPFEMPYTLDLPQADRDIWLLYDDLLTSSQHTCTEVFRLAKTKDFGVVGKQIARTGGDVYLRTLMNLDTQARLWIGKIIAGAA